MPSSAVFTVSDSVSEVVSLHQEIILDYTKSPNFKAWWQGSFAISDRKLSWDPRPDDSELATKIESDLLKFNYYHDEIEVLQDSKLSSSDLGRLSSLGFAILHSIEAAVCSWLLKTNKIRDIPGYWVPERLQSEVLKELRTPQIQLKIEKIKHLKEKISEPARAATTHASSQSNEKSPSPNEKTCLGGAGQLPKVSASSSDLAEAGIVNDDPGPSKTEQQLDVSVSKPGLPCDSSLQHKPFSPSDFGGKELCIVVSYSKDGHKNLLELAKILKNKAKIDCSSSGYADFVLWYMGNSDSFKTHCHRLREQAKATGHWEHIPPSYWRSYRYLR